MIELKQIKAPDTLSFYRLIPLYLSAFPEEERREIESLERLIKERPEMCFNAVLSDGELAGLFVYWDFEAFYYIEHLAVYPEMRNRKIGRQVLSLTSDCWDGLRLLEVEPPTDEISARRVDFYIRNGYHVVDRNYIQPSYDGVRPPVQLWIMGSEICPGHGLQEHICTIKQEVYYRNQ